MTSRPVISLNVGDVGPVVSSDRATLVRPGRAWAPSSPTPTRSARRRDIGVPYDAPVDKFQFHSTQRDTAVQYPAPLGLQPRVRAYNLVHERIGCHHRGYNMILYRPHYSSRQHAGYIPPQPHAVT